MSTISSARSSSPLVELDLSAPHAPPAGTDAPTHTPAAAAEAEPHRGVPAAHRKITFADVDWTTTIAISAMHIGCIAAPFTFSWSALGVAALLWWLTGGLGICLCFHRLLTHRSFQTPKWVEYTLTILGCMSWQGSAVNWVGTHRLHHAESDQPGDPHSPQHGFTWAHMLWCMVKDPTTRPPREAAKDLLRDPFHRVLDRWFFVPQFVLAAVLFLLGGWSWVVWGVCVRIVFGYHFTWFVNSAAHTWGYRNFETNDGSKNTWWLALFSFGEGWHNNHHAQQRSAAHGMRWWEVDLTYLTILAMEKIGLAKRVVRPKLPGSDAKPNE